MRLDSQISRQLGPDEVVNSSMLCTHSIRTKRKLENVVLASLADIEESGENENSPYSLVR